MFIKYDEIELIEFFESEPIFIGDEEAWQKKSSYTIWLMEF